MSEWQPTKLDQIAEAIEGAYRNHDDSRDAMRRMARAAVEAMREPTEAMKKAACVEADKHGYYHTRGYFDVEEADYAWRSMADAILTETPSQKGAEE